jgi:hypothetical protein
VLEADSRSRKPIDLLAKLLLRSVVEVFDEDMRFQILDNAAKSPLYRAKTCNFTPMMQRSTQDVWATGEQSIPNAEPEYSH